MAKSVFVRPHQNGVSFNSVQYLADSNPVHRTLYTVEHSVNT